VPQLAQFVENTFLFLSISATPAFDDVFATVSYHSESFVPHFWL
jgi:hypothetical protein